MLEVLPTAPAGVLVFKAVGELTADDYRDVLDPAVEAALAEHDDLRVVIVLGPEWSGMTIGAMWQDMSVGFGKLSRWKRCAVVTDRDWVEHATNAFAWMKPGVMKTFEMDEVDDAMRWAASDD